MSNAMSAVIRSYRPEDAEALAELYRASVRALGPAGYDARQIEAWSNWPEDLEAFRQMLGRGTTLIAEIEGRPAGFAQLDPPDHIALLYTAGAHARRGLASTLYRQLEERARQAGVTRLTTEASRIARPFFGRMGFVVVESELAVRAGVTLERFRMARTLTDDGQRPAESAP